ncbi:helix-turn-helix domain-containing protein [Pseudomonas sp. UL073]|uniref:Helix-turn-helix domain-containing protein n=1 Tax=Zestomonas insulae TaxID=2809017 RepID=A0ABS2I941_9GAMM|nr:helix-turn-helix domain-containing protein [Pseudomonas insulae]
MAQADGVSVRTVYKWLKCFREEGKPGLMDRS